MTRSILLVTAVTEAIWATVVARCARSVATRLVVTAPTNSTTPRMCTNSARSYMVSAAQRRADDAGAEGLDHGAHAGSATVPRGRRRNQLGRRHAGPDEELLEPAGHV